jgi:2,4-dienoyl-CoA reductase-like NADH-dependent reductase (Old Yellow Enzyme family)
MPHLFQPWSDWVECGWDMADTIALSLELERRGCAAIHVSSGGVSPAQAIRLGPGYQVPFARQVREPWACPPSPSA